MKSCYVANAKKKLLLVMLLYIVAMKDVQTVHMQSVLAIPIKELAELPDMLVPSVIFFVVYVIRTL